MHSSRSSVHCKLHRRRPHSSLWKPPQRPNRRTRPRSRQRPGGDAGARGWRPAWPLLRL